MGTYSGMPSKKKSQEVSEAGRGIGCLLIIVIPIISFFIGTQLVNYAVTHNISLPRELLGKQVLPDLINRSYGLRAVFGPLAQIPNLYANLLAGLICLIVISSLISLIYAVVARIMNPDSYGPTDAPPPKRKLARKTKIR
jgi:hypothetical protein